MVGKGLNPDSATLYDHRQVSASLSLPLYTGGCWEGVT